jgi:hypothetical protein
MLLFSVAAGQAQEVQWRPSQSTGSSAVTLGQPGRLSADAPPEPQSRVVRAQIGDPPPPPTFPGGGPPVVAVPNSVDIYNKGMPNNDADLGGFWTRCGEGFKRCWSDVTGSIPGAFQPGPTRSMFQSDCEFAYFSSPVTNPFFFEDPRALTEIRPVFIWQATPSSNPVWGGGNNFHYAVRGSVAFTPYISFVFSRFGFSTINPDPGTPTIQPDTGFSEVLLGPKITFIRNEDAGRVVAFGITFDIPAGSSSVLQDTGELAIVPYLSYAQTFGKTAYGSFNFMNTTGYTFRTDSERSESFYSSFHLDYNIASRFYPMVELNWRHYTKSGSAQPLNFEGNDLANFGSQNVAGENELTLAFGGRIKINNWWWWGIATEFNVLSNSDGRHLDRFRLTTDFIFRY